MSDAEETTPVVRKTRSGRAVKTPAKKAATAKPAGRKTRKKVVVMEVEVTDEEDNEQTEESGEPAGKKAKIDEDKLLESDGESSEEATKNEEDTAKNSEEDEKADKKTESAELLVMNDIEMLEEIIHTNEKITEDVEKNDETNGENENAKENGVAEIEEKPVTDDKIEELATDKKSEEKPVIEEKSEEIPAVDKKSDEKADTNEKSEEKAATDEKIEEKPVTVEKIEETKSEDVKVAEKKEDNEKGQNDAEEKEKVAEKKENVAEEKEKVAETEVKEESKESAETTEAKSAEKSEEADKPAEVQTKEETSDDTKTEKETTDDKSVEKDQAKEEIADKTVEKKEDEEKSVEEEKAKPVSQNGEPEAENISDDELPGVPVAKVPETEEVSDEELPGPKRAELPADTEVVSEDELPTTKKEEAEEEESASPSKKEGNKRKLSDNDYDPTSPTSENEAPAKKSKEDKDDKEKEGGESKSSKPKKLPELDKYWKAVNDDPTDFTGWTYLLQYVDQENDMEAAREAYDAFLSHYPYCYGYWRKYADYEKRKGNKKKCEEVFERGLKAIPLSVDLWIHYLAYVKTTRGEDEEYVRSQFERALGACGLEFRSDRLWDSYIKWETEGKRLQRVTAIFDRLLTTPTQGYTTHFDNFQEHVAAHTPNKILEVDEFLALRKECKNLLKDDAKPADNADLPPGDEDSKLFSSDEETKCIRERIVSIRRKVHKNTVNAVTARWNFEEGIKRPYFHVKPLERCQLKNWQEYLDYEIGQGDRTRIIVLFERCLIACALYEEFWMKFVHYMENLKDPELTPKIREVYERACTIHHLKKPNLHLQWAIFEEAANNVSRAAEILVNLEKQVPNLLQVAYRRINLERRRADNEKAAQLFEHYIGNSKNKMISSTIAIKYSRFCLRVLKDVEKAQEALRTAITKDPNNPRLYLQLIDLILQKPDTKEEEVCAVIDEFLEKETADPDQKALFAQRKLEYLEDFGTNIETVRTAYEEFQKYQKLCKESAKKKEPKSDSTSSSKKEKPASSSTSQSTTAAYPNYNYGNSSTQPAYPYSGTQQGQYNYAQYGQGDQYQYQNWQYPQGGYGGYNQWGGYGGGYSY